MREDGTVLEALRWVVDRVSQLVRKTLGDRDHIVDTSITDDEIEFDIDIALVLRIAN